ncbi:hypothetical protein L21SP3_01175 [Sedimentisphaera cyanobacteriorum]|uniref:Uncharacterized protein n=1 Tax=Sedimentisphaera cyanobacteriorum TaxID=1940790 RepID=A0A1Q2HPX0_9BACT|nr:hypothetical protein [Sedimentisphaera cyanobacteriorum]AQQ09371.1 hypothetical protein L21SP3_01175 [Sedimentisphaera cyanobacteriorum]
MNISLEEVSEIMRLSAIETESAQDREAQIKQLENTLHLLKKISSSQKESRNIDQEAWKEIINFIEAQLDKSRYLQKQD